MKKVKKALTKGTQLVFLLRDFKSKTDFNGNNTIIDIETGRIKDKNCVYRITKYSH